MPFEVFTKATTSAKEAPTISIQRRGVISFNQSAHKLLGEPQAVELLYDNDRQRVGLRHAEPAVPHAQRVRTNGKGTTYLVSAMSFTAHYDIPIDMGHRWEAQLEDDILFIDLNQPPVA